MYKIEISFRTGDSFGSEDRIEFLELEWNDKNIAKQNLQRIKEHYKYFNGSNYRSKEEKVKPEWISEEDLNEHSIKLLSDDNKIWQIYPFWVGYFECLYGAKIIYDDPDMSFTII